MPYCATCGQEFEAGVATCSDCGEPLQATPPTDAQRAQHPDETVVDVFITQDPSEADIVAGLLTANDIACSQHSGVPQNVLPLHVDKMEAIRIFVPAHDAAAARALITAQHEEPDDG